MIAIVSNESSVIKDNPVTRIIPVKEIIFDVKRSELILVYDTYVRYVYSLSGSSLEHVEAWITDCAYDRVIDTRLLHLLYVTGYEV